MRLVFFDLETGGLDPLKHPIIQIAAIAVDEQLEPIEEFERKFLFDFDAVDAEALAGNSFNAEVWAREAIEPVDACQDFSNFLGRFSDVENISKRTGRPYKVAQLIGHNAATFDALFLKKAFTDVNLFLPASYQVLCTMQRAMFAVMEREYAAIDSYKLGDLCKRFSVPLENAHDALADVRATVGLYRMLRKF